MPNTNHATSAFVGANFGTPGTSADFSVGSRAIGTNGTEWVYVKASAALTQYAAVAVDEDYNATSLTKALADAGHRVGWAQAAFAANDYGWVAISGSNIQGRVAASCAADVALYTTATAGVMDDDPTAQTKLNGVRIVTAGSAGGISNREMIVTNPWT